MTRKTKKTSAAARWKARLEFATLQLPPDARAQRRIRLVEVPYAWIPWVIHAGIRWASDVETASVGRITLPVARPPLPDDAQVCQIVFSPERDTWLIALSSMEWSPIPDGLMAPMLDPPVQLVDVRLLHVTTADSDQP